jgi:hypothetical protein
MVADTSPPLPSTAGLGRKDHAMKRRQMVGAAAGLALPGAAMVGPARAADGGHEAAARAARAPLRASADDAVVMRELVRCATLAANSHNTQPWTFELSPGAISIRPDLSRRTPVVDPDDHHLWVSLGCATENLVVAAAALGRRAHAEVTPEGVRLSLDSAAALDSPLADAIFARQCTRGTYDGRALPSDVVARLERAATGNGVRVLVLTRRDRIEGVLEHVVQGNSAQMRDPAFVSELKQWIRFSKADALATGDGLFAGASGNPTLPRWLGSPLFSLFYREKPENDKVARQIRSSSGIAVFAAERADPAHWLDVGRAYERFALLATTLGVRSAFVNQAVEVPTVRVQFAQWLGLGPQRPDLVVRFGRGPQLPYSLRRPIGHVIVQGRAA